MKLKIRDMVFAYSSMPVLDNVCLEIVPSEILGIVGPNGGGKSTLIKCIDNILKPQKGSILLDERDIGKMSRIEIARRMGYVPQVSSRVFPATVFDTVLMGRRPHLGWRSHDQDIDRVVEILELLKMDDLALKYFGELSGGQQQKVFIARALAQEAKLLLLDEPTSNLDINHQFEVMHLIRSLAEEKGFSVIMTLHDLNLASRFSDRILMLHGGKIFAVGSPEEILTPENIREVYKVEVIVNNDSKKPHIIPVGVSEGGYQE